MVRQPHGLARQVLQEPGAWEPQLGFLCQQPCQSLDPRQLQQVVLDPHPTTVHFSLDLPELITVTEDQIHVLVKSLEGANEDAAVLQDAPHPVVNMLQHLAALAHPLWEAKSGRSPEVGEFKTSLTNMEKPRLY
ncbi:hypothetical protein AAY473_035509 [Plecturocebus cupreus]